MARNAQQWKTPCMRLAVGVASWQISKSIFFFFFAPLLGMDVSAGEISTRFYHFLGEDCELLLLTGFGNGLGLSNC